MAALLLSLIALSGANERIDTIRFDRSKSRYPSDKLVYGTPVIVLDGVALEWMGDNTDDYVKRNIKPGTIMKWLEFDEPEICVQFGKDALEHGVVFIVTKENAGKVAVPKRKSRPAEKPSSAFDVTGAEGFDKVPYFNGNESPDAFQIWVNDVMMRFDSPFKSPDWTPAFRDGKTVKTVVAYPLKTGVPTIVY